MVLRSVAGAGQTVRTSDDTRDLCAWLRDLPGAPPVHEVVVLSCPAHDEDQPTWAYVEADAGAGVARRRCLACGTAVGLLDSDEHWTHPMMFACQGCGHSIAELAAGLSAPDGEHVEWVVLGARCVECGRLAGLTDVVVDGVPVTQVLAHL